MRILIHILANRFNIFESYAHMIKCTTIIESGSKTLCAMVISVHTVHVHTQACTYYDQNTAYSKLDFSGLTGRLKTFCGAQ